MYAFPRTLFSTSLCCRNWIYCGSNLRRISFSAISPCLLSTPKKNLHYHTNTSFAAKLGSFSPKLSHSFSTEYLHLSREDSSNAHELKQLLARSSKRYGRWRKPDPHKQIYVCEIDPNLDSEQFFIELFSQFGKVKKVYISEMSKLDDSRYAIITFGDRESAEKALQAKKVTTTYGSSMFIQRRVQTTTRSTTNRTYIMPRLPDNIDATHIFHHFKSFCDVELVFINIYMKNLTVGNYKAAIILKEELNSIILHQKHTIGNSILSVDKAAEDFVVTGRSRRKCLNVFLQGVSDNVTKDEIYSYFKRFGEITQVHIIIDEDTGRRNGFGYVNFSNQTSAHSAAQGVHKVSDSYIKAYALGCSS